MTISVTDFGARGDGKADDTAAVLAALAAAKKKTWSEQIPGGSYYLSRPAVHFPSGKYLLSGTLPADADLVGDGGSILYMADPAKDIVSGQAVWRWRAAGLTFVGGKNQLHLGNANINSGNYLVQRCAFYAAADAAVRVRPGTNSTHLAVRDCIFREPLQVLVTCCDTTTFVENWVQTSPAMRNLAAIENRGMWLTVQHMRGVPAVDPNADQRWIDNRGVGVLCRDARFGGERGGFCPVVNWTRFDHSHPVWPAYVKLESCHVYARGLRRSAVYLEEVPNVVTVEGCLGLVDLQVVRLRPSINPDSYFNVPDFRDTLVRFRLAGNVEVKAANAALPPGLKRFLEAA